MIVSTTRVGSTRQWADRWGNGFDIHLASGGHPPPLVSYADGSAYYVDTFGGQAVGLMNEPHFVASQFVLAPGDTLMLYTDGLTEASTRIGRERYDDEGALLRFAQEHSPTSARPSSTPFPAYSRASARRRR